MAPDYEPLADRLREFESNVWIHTEDAFLLQFDTTTDIPDESVEALEELLAALEAGADEKELTVEITRRVAAHGDAFFAKLLQLVGLTRNKLVTDVEAIGKAAGVNEKPARTYDVIPRKPEHWPLAAAELASRFTAVFGPSTPMDRDHWAGLIGTVNRATWPGWIRQERAKRSGHHAEARLARICAALEVDFEPRAKAEQDIAADVRVNGESFDLVFPDTVNPRACVIATVHTANIGQFGESKDAGDIARARAALDGLDPSPKLVALADGLGFRSNRAGLEGVLDIADEFCQFRTIWKAVTVGAEASDDTLELFVPNPEEFDDFLDRYSATLELLDERPDEGVEAGDGVFASLA